MIVRCSRRLMCRKRDLSFDCNIERQYRQNTVKSGIQSPALALVTSSFFVIYVLYDFSASFPGKSRISLPETSSCKPSKGTLHLWLNQRWLWEADTRSLLRKTSIGQEVMWQCVHSRMKARSTACWWRVGNPINQQQNRLCTPWTRRIIDHLWVNCVWSEQGNHSVRDFHFVKKSGWPIKYALAFRIFLC